MDYFEIGARIRARRKALGMSQEQLAEMVNISTTHMSHIETGNTKLSLGVLVDLARALQTGCDRLIFGEKQADSRLAAMISDISESQKALLAELAKAVKNNCP